MTDYDGTMKVSPAGAVEIDGESVSIYDIEHVSHTFTAMRPVDSMSNFGEPVTLGCYFEATEGTVIVNKITGEERNFLGRVSKPGENQVDPAPSGG